MKMTEPILYHIKTFRNDAWFLDTDGLWFLSAYEAPNDYGSCPRDVELVVSNSEPMYTENHPPWDNSSVYAPPEDELPERVTTDYKWWGWWTDDITNVEPVRLCEAPSEVIDAFWERFEVRT